MTALSPQEMQSLTGAISPKKQIEVLRNNGVPFLVNARNHPITTWDAVNKILTGSRTLTQNAAGFNLDGAR